jgi:hypothetical protein
VGWQGEPFVWQGVAGEDWHNAENWDIKGVPCDGAAVVITAGANMVLTNSTAALSSFTMSGGNFTFGGWDTKVTAEQVELSGGEVTHQPNTAKVSPWTPNARVWFECTNFVLAAGATINVVEKGYAAGGASQNGYGPGRGLFLATYAQGAAYGGFGAAQKQVTAARNAMPYGSAAEPIDPGSGGAAYNQGRGGHGGGAVRIAALGDVVINGLVTANGGTAQTDFSGNHGAGGAGGAIYITCNRFISTNGVLRADGGSSRNKASGTMATAAGGGRIAIAYNKAAQCNDLVYRATISVAAGKEMEEADMGTIWLPGPLLLESYGAQVVGQLWGFDTWSVDGLSITNSNIRLAEEGFQLSVAGDLAITGSGARLGLGGTEVKLTLARVGFFGGSEPLALNVGGDVTINGGGVLEVFGGMMSKELPWCTTVNVGGALTVGSGSSVITRSDPVNGGSVFFNVADVTVASGATFTADGFGYGGGTKAYLLNGYGYGLGRGIGGDNKGNGGGGHGGAGGWPGYGGEVNDDPERPVLAGSGGGGEQGIGGRGGGVIRIRASGHVQVDGKVTADGGERISNHTGGGAGGAVFIEAKSFGGGVGGQISAKGSDGYSTLKRESGGGGGCVAIWTGFPYDESVSRNRVIVALEKPETLPFAGTINVAGGAASYAKERPGEVGTIRFVRVTAPAGTVMLLR